MTCRGSDRRPWMMSDKRELIRLARLGLSVREIAEALDRTPWAVTIWMHRHGLSLLEIRAQSQERSETFAWTRRDVEDMLRLRAEGKSFARIACEIGRTDQACRSKYYYLTRSRTA